MGDAGRDDELREQILKALSALQDPDLGKDVVAAGFVKELVLKKFLLGTDVTLNLELTTPACPIKDHFASEAKRLIESVPGVRAAKVNVTGRVQGRAGTKRLPNVSHVIAVGSGKGGVGKSTVSLNLALALKAEGASVGYLDADVQGPSAAILLGLSTMPQVKEGRIQPVPSHGIPVMSFAFFAPVGEATLLRGAQSSKAVEQMLKDVEWPALDYLVVDLPPGTGDVHLGLYHAVDVSGAVLVSTPQNLAVADALKGLAMFRKMKIPVLGIVENMSGEIFGSGGAEREAERQGIPFLGRIPLDGVLVKGGDRGEPIVAANPDHPIAKVFRELARKVAHRLSVVAQTEPLA